MLISSLVKQTRVFGHRTIEKKTVFFVCWFADSRLVWTFDKQSHSNKHVKGKFFLLFVSSLFCSLSVFFDFLETFLFKLTCMFRSVQHLNDRTLTTKKTCCSVPELDVKYKKKRYCWQFFRCSFFSFFNLGCSWRIGRGYCRDFKEVDRDQTSGSFVFFRRLVCFF